jgi:hypothetical protein
MLNVTMRKIGGIRFLAIGRISISLSVSTPTAYWAKFEARCEHAAMAALVRELAS